MARWKHGIPSRSELHDAKREAVLREASASFKARGYHGTSMEDIASRLSVTKSALYYYFPNKQTLLKACFDQAMRAAFDDLAGAERAGKSGLEKLRLALSSLLDSFLGEHSVAITVLEEGSLSAPDFEAVKAERRRYEHALRAFVREGIADGSIIPCDPKAVVLVMLGALGGAQRWYRDDGEWSRAQTISQLCDLLERMISRAPADRLPSPSH